MVPAHADPVVKSLQRKLRVLGRLQLDDSEAAIRGNGEQVEHAAVGGCEGRHLRVDVRGVELFVEHAKIAVEHAFEPALGLQAVERIALVGLREAAFAQARNQRSQLVFVAFREQRLTRTRAEADLFDAIEALSRRADADARELESMQQEGELGAAAQPRLHHGAEGLGNHGQHARGGVRETQRGVGGVGRVDQSRDQVAVVGGVARGQLFVARVELPELPLARIAREPRHAGERGGGPASRNDELEAVNDAAVPGSFAASDEPEDAEGQDAVDGGGRFLLIDRDDSPGFLPQGQQAARVGRAEGLLEVHGGAEVARRPVGELAFERTLENFYKASAGGVPR